MAEIIERKKKDGTFSYMIRVYSGRTRDDKVITKCKTVTPPTGMGKKKTEKWVQEQAILFEQKVTNGLVLDSDVLLDDLIDRWFEEYANKRLKPKTVYDYKRMRPRISAGFGHLKVSKIKPAQIMAFYDNLEEKGIRRDSTYTATPALLKLLPHGPRGVLAKKAGIGLDTMRMVYAGRKVSRQTAEKVSATVGLAFSKVFVEHRQKGGKLNNNSILHYHAMLSSVFKIGSAWVRKVTLENGKVVDNDMLFTKWDGEPMDPDIISTWFSKFLTEHGLPQVHFHSLRHPYVKHTTKIFSLRLMDFQAQAYPDARRKTRGACQLLRVGQSRSPVRPLCNRKRFSCLPPQSKMSWILYAISMRLSGYTSTRSISSSASSVVSVSASKIALDASMRLSCRACSSCFCFACANTAA